MRQCIVLLVTDSEGICEVMIVTQGLVGVIAGEVGERVDQVGVLA